jgi:hypothetical protein
MRLKALLLCLLPALLTAPWLSAPCWGQTAPTVLNPGDGNIPSEISGASAGTVFQFAAGTFNFSSPITVPSGVTLEAATPVMGPTAVPNSSFIVFNLPGGNNASYGFVIAPNASNVKIQGLDITSNMGIVQMSNGGAYSGIIITDNNMKYGTGQLSDGTLIFGIYGTVTNNGLQITYNYFHDTQGTIRNWCVWYANNANFDYNEFYNINDGGQIDNPGPSVSCSYNYGTYMHRMGQEVALDAQSTFTCTGNVFYSYYQPYNDTEGVSIIGVSSTVNITNNYFNASMAPGGWGQADSGGTHRFGYAIEGTGAPGNVTGNTLIGAWADDVSSDIANLNVSNNTVYGTALWGAFDGEPGPYGYGSVVTSNNSINSDVGSAPAAPTNTFAGPEHFNGTGSRSVTGPAAGSGGSGPTGGNGAQTSSNGVLIVQGVTVQVLDSTDVKIAWDPNLNPTFASVTVKIISTVGRQNFPDAVDAGAVNPFTIGNMHPGWYIDFTVVGKTAAGVVYTSQVVTVHTPGNSIAAWAGTLWGGISNLQTNPYTN